MHQGLTALLLDDRMYVDPENAYDRQGRMLPFAPTIHLLVYTARAVPPDLQMTITPYLQVDVAPDTQTLCIMAPFAKREHHPLELMLNYTRLAGPMTALLRQAYPDDAYVQSLKPQSFPPVNDSQDIPASALAQIVAVHPGMTRADLLKTFTTEGGLSTRLHRTYIFRGATVSESGTAIEDANGIQKRVTRSFARLIKVNVEFLPRQAQIKWVDGVGPPVSEQQAVSVGGWEASDDIIVRISKPYLAFFTAD